MKRQIYKLKDTAQTDYTTLDPQNLHLFVDESEESGGGAIDSVNGQTGVVVLDADDIAETATRFWLTSALKTAYDGAVTWVTNSNANIRATVLTGLSSSSGTFTSSNTILEAFGKVKYFIDNIQTVIGAHVNLLLNDCTSSASLTGTTTETQIGSSILIPANTFASGDSFTIDAQLNRNATAVSTVNFRAKINTTNTFAGATQIAIAQQGTTLFSCPLVRTACFKTASNFEIIASGSATNNDLIASSNVVASTIAFDTTVDNYLFFSGQLFNVADSFYLSRVTITKRKSKSTI